MFCRARKNQESGEFLKLDLTGKRGLAAHEGTRFVKMGNSSNTIWSQTLLRQRPEFTATTKRRVAIGMGRFAEGNLRVGSKQRLMVCLAASLVVAGAAFGAPT